MPQQAALGTFGHKSVLETALSESLQLQTLAIARAAAGEIGIIDQSVYTNCRPIGAGASVNYSALLNLAHGSDGMPECQPFIRFAHCYNLPLYIIKHAATG